MLTKILQINRNFISVLLFIGIAVYVMFMGFSENDTLISSLSVVFVLLSLVLSSLSLFRIKLFSNQFFSFFLCLCYFLFYTAQAEFEFYAALMMLYVLINQIVIGIFYGNAILNSFDIGFFAGFMILFFPPFIFFLLPIWIYYLILGQTEYIRFFLNIFGLLVFGILFFELMVVFDWWFLWENILEGFTIRYINIDYNFYFLIPFIIVFLMAEADYFSNINRHSANKKLLFFFSLMTIFSTIIYGMFFGGNVDDKWLLLSFPFALFWTNYFTFNKNIIRKEILILVLIISALIYKFHTYITLPELFDNITF